MKKFLLALITLLVFANGNAQIVNPVKWTNKVEKLSETEFNLVMEGKIEQGWHLYSQFTPENGPLPAEFKFENAKGNYELIDKTKESILPSKTATLLGNVYQKVFSGTFGTLLKMLIPYVINWYLNRKRGH